MYSRGPIDNNAVLFVVMAWRRKYHKPLLWAIDG